MPNVIGRGATRAARRRFLNNRAEIAPPKTRRGLLAPPKSRRGLLAGTALAGGALVALGALLAMPKAALAADCVTNSTAGIYIINCSSATNTGVYYNDDSEYRTEINIESGGNLNINGDAIGVHMYNYTDDNRTIHIEHDNGDPGNGYVYGYWDAYDLSIYVDHSEGGGDSAVATLDGFVNGRAVAEWGQAIDFDTNASEADVNLTFGEDSVLQSRRNHVTRFNLSESETAYVSLDAQGLITTEGGSGEDGGDGIAVYGADRGIGRTYVDITNSGTINVEGRGIYVQHGQSSESDQGYTSIINTGHIQGTEGAGVEVSEGGGVFYSNNSYKSVMGTDGLYIHDSGLAAVQNEGGLTAGLTNDGVRIDNISGSGVALLNGELVTIDNNLDSYQGAVHVDNYGGGVILGYEDGVSVTNVNGSYDSEDGEGDAVNVFIHNDGGYSTAEGGEVERWYKGGLIAGMHGDGIYAYNINGEVEIDNSFTRQGSIDFSQLDPQVYGTEGDLLGTESDPTLPGSEFTTGIYGGENGINLNYVERNISIYNFNGQIVGANEDGIQISESGGGILIDNSGGWLRYADEFVSGGTIWGGEDGIHIEAAYGGNVLTEGDVFNTGTPDFNIGINNDLGSVFGAEGDGVDIEAEGGVQITNFGGSIVGWDGEGVRVSSNDKVGLFSGGAYQWGDGEGDVPAHGYIVGDDSAIDINADSAFVFNGFGGAVYGDGESGAVVYLSTSTNQTVNGRGGSLPFLDNEVGALVMNGGLMTSWNDPNVEWGSLSEGDVNVFPDTVYNDDTTIKDANDIAKFAWTGGTDGSIDNVDQYWWPANDLLIASETGATTVFNGDLINYYISRLSESDEQVGLDTGVMVGRIQVTGNTYVNDVSESNEDGFAANSVVNYGKWMTTNWANESGWEYGNIVDSNESGEDGIYNMGVIQTAFWSEGDDHTTFVTDDFYNADPSGGYLSYMLSEGGESDTNWSGLISMVDGQAGDWTGILANFWGGEFGETSGYSTSFLAVDVNFGPKGEGGVSDVLQIGDYSESDWRDVYGTTGIIAHKLNSETDPNTEIGDRIPVVYAFTGDDSEDYTCLDTWCVEGNSFYVSKLSPDYVNVDGVGFIRDGMFMWGLQESEVGPDPETDWVATWSPDAHDQPTVVSTLQTAWYDTVGVVEDHVYGNTYPAATGGSGADLPAASSSGQTSSLWGRITGNWSKRTATIDQDTPPLVFDTSLSQDTYSVTAGAEFRPDDGTDGVRLGLYGGYLSSSARFDSYGGSAKAQGGSVGGYAALIKGPWYLDAEVKADFLTNTYSSNYVTLDASATNVGVLANTGYRFENGAGFFEPILSFAYLNTTLGSASGGGGTVTYDNGQSIRAGAGARVGMTVGKPGATQTEFDLLGKVWNEFGSPNQVTVSDGNPAHDVTYTDSISGVYGEVTGRATVYNADRSASGFLSVGGKFGSNSTSVSAKAGLRKNF
jgi:hypothetical protein